MINKFILESPFSPLSPYIYLSFHIEMTKVWPCYWSGTQCLMTAGPVTPALDEARFFTAPPPPIPHPSLSPMCLLIMTRQFTSHYWHFIICKLKLSWNLTSTNNPRNLGDEAVLVCSLFTNSSSEYDTSVYNKRQSLSRGNKCYFSLWRIPIHGLSYLHVNLQ